MVDKVLTVKEVADHYFKSDGIEALQNLSYVRIENAELQELWQDAVFQMEDLWEAINAIDDFFAVNLEESND